MQPKTNVTAHAYRSELIDATDRTVPIFAEDDNTSDAGFVLFLSVVFSASAPGPEPAIGAVLGLAVAVGIGVAIFWGGVRVDLRRFFLVTAVVLMFVAAGLCAYAVHEFGEAGLIANSGQVFDLSGVLPDSSPLGALLSGLFGYRPSPTPLEVVAYFAYLIPVVAIYVWTDRPRQAARPATA